VRKSLEKKVFIFPEYRHSFLFTEAAKTLTAIFFDYFKSENESLPHAGNDTDRNSHME